VGGGVGGGGRGGDSTSVECLFSIQPRYTEARRRRRRGRRSSQYPPPALHAAFSGTFLVVRRITPLPPSSAGGAMLHKFVQGALFLSAADLLHVVSPADGWRVDARTP